MKKLTVSSFAKINLGLKVLGLRPDGYHEIRTVLQTIDLADEILLEEDDVLSLVVEGRYPIPADDSNLVMQAARSLAERYPGRGARITLRKTIPPGAGLGGGSSNAAATLMALDRLWEVEEDPGLLYGLARRLGADVPFFLYGGTCLAVGKGDEVLPLPDAAPWTVAVLWPGIGLSTKEVYAGLPSALTRARILSSMKGFVPGLSDPATRDPELAGEPGTGDSDQAGPAASPPDVDNDLEETAFLKVPALSRLKERLLERGAVAAAVSGSGSAVFGLFPAPRGVEKAVASLAVGETAAFVCKTLSRDAYCLYQFKRSRT